VVAIFDTLVKEIPSPKTELDYTNHYTLLVAIVLSAQSTDIGVNKATKKLFETVSNPSEMLTLGEEALKGHIKTIGLYNAKAKNIIKLSEILVNEYHSKVPENFDQLISLPGVGRKTANVFLNCACNIPTIAVDTHVARVSFRLGLTSHKDPYKIEQDLLQIIPSNHLQDAHHLLILHGRYVCQARKPKCELCPIEKFCMKNGV
jgi:endonuclease-3